ncbi:MAG: DNA-processing protein DprA [Saprospiraceae bacterium]|nr:DNA-processing protein DprA [Saprospiraceae bacterium]
MSDSLLHQIALTLVPQVGAVTAKTLVSYCGSAEAVFQARRQELLKIPGIGPTVADCLQLPEPLQQAERELVFLEKNHVTALFYTHDRYPVRLRQCHDSPAMLFFKGSSVDLLNAERIIAMVGTRQPTDYGKALCEEIVEGLKPYNVLMVSGLAYGVDITAHRKATAVNMPNIGVLGQGLASIYPAQHRSTAEKMLENGGLLTEYIAATRPDRENFPMRNRIIAGLCDALVVVESAISGGSMISAEMASGNEREVFALPGRAKDPKSAGCNLLIKSMRAKLMESAADLAAALQWPEPGKSKTVQTKLFLDLSIAETRLLELIRQTPDIPIDLLSSSANLPPGELAALLLALEFKGAIRTLPGKRYRVMG